MTLTLDGNHTVYMVIGFSMPINYLYKLWPFREPIKVFILPIRIRPFQAWEKRTFSRLGEPIKLICC